MMRILKGNHDSTFKTRVGYSITTHAKNIMIRLFVVREETFNIVGAYAKPGDMRINNVLAVKRDTPLREPDVMVINIEGWCCILAARKPNSSKTLWVGDNVMFGRKFINVPIVDYSNTIAKAIGLINIVRDIENSSLILLEKRDEILLQLAFKVSVKCRKKARQALRCQVEPQACGQVLRVAVVLLKVVRGSAVRDQ